MHALRLVRHYFAAAHISKCHSQLQQRAKEIDATVESAPVHVTGPVLLTKSVEAWQQLWGDDIVLEAGELNQHQPRDASRNAVTILMTEYVLPFEWDKKPDVCNVGGQTHDSRACRDLYPQAYCITYCTCTGFVGNKHTTSSPQGRVLGCMVEPHHWLRFSP